VGFNGSSSELVLHVPLFPIMTTTPYVNLLESESPEIIVEELLS